MKIDSVSANIIRLALYVDSNKPGTISEIWLENELLTQLKSSLPSQVEIPKFTEKLQNEIDALHDNRRKIYLSELFSSLEFQLHHTSNTKVSLEKFTQDCFGITIPPVSEEEIFKQEQVINKLEKELGKTRQEIIANQQVDTEDIQSEFLSQLSHAKEFVGKKLGVSIPESESFIFKLTTNESWSAFNKHTSPFTSELILNADYPVTHRETRYLAFHEGYGGHHTELALKDNLLVHEGRGEHGLVITYSPQTFMSEAIAVNAQDYFDSSVLPPEIKLLSEYSHLSGGLLLNKVAYMYFQDKMPKSEISLYLENQNLTEDSRKFILNFATDPTYGIYTLVYQYAGKFINEAIQSSSNPNELIKQIYTLPTTPNMIASK